MSSYLFSRVCECELIKKSSFLSSFRETLSLINTELSPKHKFNLYQQFISTLHFLLGGNIITGTHSCLLALGTTWPTHAPIQVSLLFLFLAVGRLKAWLTGKEKGNYVYVWAILCCTKYHKLLCINFIFLHNQYLTFSTKWWPNAINVLAFVQHPLKVPKNNNQL